MPTYSFIELTNICRRFGGWPELVGQVSTVTIFRKRKGMEMSKRCMLWTTLMNTK